MTAAVVEPSSQRRQWYGVAAFLVLGFALSWGIWSVLLLTGGSLKSPLAVPLLALGMWGPGVSALVVTRLVLRENWRTTTINQLGRWRYYVWAWFLPVVSTVVALGLTVLFGLARLDLSFPLLRNSLAEAHVTVPVPLWVIVGAQVAMALTLAPMLNVLFAIGEELGWRGFLLPRLMQAGLGQWAALIVSGAIWGLWHAPIIAQGFNYPAHPYWGILLMTGFTTLLGVIFGWLQLASGSVWVPAIAHASLNAIAGLPIILLTPFDTAICGTLTSLVGWIPLAAFIVWLAWSGRLPVRWPTAEVATAVNESP